MEEKLRFLHFLYCLVHSAQEEFNLWNFHSEKWGKQVKVEDGTQSFIFFRVNILLLTFLSNPSYWKKHSGLCYIIV